MKKYQGAIQVGALWRHGVAERTGNKVRLTGFEVVMQKPQPVFGWESFAFGLEVRAALRQAFSYV